MWVGNYNETINTLLDFEKRGIVRNKRQLDETIQYISKKAPNITSYSLHKDLGRKNSSAGAEKTNDLIVANRQKHQDMSWTNLGGISLANISQTKLNNRISDYVRGNKQIRWFGPCTPSNDEVYEENELMA